MAHGLVENDDGLTLYGGEWIYQDEDAFTLFRLDAAGNIPCTRRGSYFTPMNIPPPLNLAAQETLKTHTDLEGVVAVQVLNTLNVDFEVFDPQGRPVIAVDVKAALSELDLSYLAKGMYGLRFRTGKGSINRKVILE